MNQTDAKANSNGAAASEAASAPTASSNGSDLDALLNEFEKGTTANANTAVPKLFRAMDQKIGPVVDFVAQQAQAKLHEKVEADIKTAVSTAKAGLPESIPEVLIEGYLHKLVADNPDARKAWESRDESPDAWRSTVAKANEDLKSMAPKLVPTEQPKPQPNDLARAEAAVRNVSTEPPAKPSFDPVKLVHEMNDREYAAWKREYYRAQQAAQS